MEKKRTNAGSEIGPGANLSQVGPPWSIRCLIGPTTVHASPNWPSCEVDQYHSNLGAQFRLVLVVVGLAQHIIVTMPVCAASGLPVGLLDCT